MKIRVKYDDLEKKCNEIVKESDELDEKINNLISLLEKVKENWDGEDSYVFTENANAYFNNMKQISTSLRDFARFGSSANKEYLEHDTSWKQEIEKEGGNLGKNEQKLVN